MRFNIVQKIRLKKIRLDKVRGKVHNIPKKIHFPFCAYYVIILLCNNMGKGALLVKCPAQREGGQNPDYGELFRDWFQIVVSREI